MRGAQTTKHLRGADPKNNEHDRAAGEPFLAKHAILPAIELSPLLSETLRIFLLFPPLLGHALQLILPPLCAERGDCHHFDGSLGTLFVQFPRMRRGELLIASRNVSGAKVAMDTSTRTLLRSDQGRMHGCSGDPHC